MAIESLNFENDGNEGIVMDGVAQQELQLTPDGGLAPLRRTIFSVSVILFNENGTIQETKFFRRSMIICHQIYFAIFYGAVGTNC
jgi:flagellar biosynthesis regulator FlbT